VLREGTTHEGECVATVSETIGSWLEAVKYSDLPHEIVHIAKRSILDCIGTALAGSVQQVGHLLSRYLHEIGGPKQCTVIGLGLQTSCIEAAMVNGTTSHYLDYDDLVIPAVGAGGPHITAAVLPAALAIAEREKKTGKELILAYVLGCETAYRIGRAVDPTHYNAGWHTTGTEGIFGATVAASKLLNSRQEETAYALGIAASEASGLRENFGTMTKPFHAGQAAAKGVRAALLSRLGFTSSKSILEGKTGFCNVFSKDPKPTEITKDLGEFHCMPQLRLKLYPCCAGSHSAIYATMQLVKEHNPDSNDIESVNVRGDPQMAEVLVYDSPRTATEAKFSLQFPLALALSGKKVTLNEFTDDQVTAPPMVTLMSRVKLTPEPELRAKSVHARAAIVEINLRDRTQLVNRCDYPPGTPENPISENDILEKYKTCARLALAEENVQESLEAILNLEEVQDIGKLLEVIRPNH